MKKIKHLIKLTGFLKGATFEKVAPSCKVVIGILPAIFRCHPRAGDPSKKIVPLWRGDPISKKRWRVKWIPFFKGMTTRQRFYFWTFIGALLVVLIPLALAIFQNPDKVTAAWPALSELQHDAYSNRIQSGMLKLRGFDENWRYL